MRDSAVEIPKLSGSVGFTWRRRRSKPRISSCASSILSAVRQDAEEVIFSVGIELLVGPVGYEDVAVIGTVAQESLELLRVPMTSNACPSTTIVFADRIFVLEQAFHHVGGDHGHVAAVKVVRLA